MNLIQKILFMLGIGLLPLATQAQCGNFAAQVWTDSSTTLCDSATFIQAIPIAGAAPFTYAWSNGMTGQSLFLPTNVAAGQTFSVTITDSLNCTATATGVVPPASANGPLMTSFTITQQGCTGNGLGANVDLNVSGGTPPYSFSWNNGATTQNLRNVPGGGYWVQVWDSAGCVSYEQLAVQGMMLNPSITHSSCTGNNGSIFLDSAAMGYTILWNTGATTTSLTGLASGWYGATITNPANGCVYTPDFYVGYNPNCESIISGYVWNATGNTAVCSPNLPAMTQGWVRMTNATTGAFVAQVQINSNGYYEIRNQTPGSYNLTYVFQYGSTNLTVLSPANNQITVNTSPGGGQLTGNNFCAAYPNQVDVSVDLWAWNPASGFNYQQFITLCNNGGTPATGVINYWPDQALDAPTGFTNWGAGANWYTVQSSAAGAVVLNYSNLQPGACRTVLVSFRVPVGLALGAPIQGIVDAPLAGDANLANNTDTLNNVIVGSYDPNDKRMMRHRTGDEFTGTVLPTDNNFEYIIRFQNTGTAPARRVVVRDTLESNLKTNTIRDIILSHNGQVHVEQGNILIFTFNDIMLPDSASNPEGSIGSIRFLIDRQAGLALGTEIRNDAAIYFDFNEPIYTNDAVTTIMEPSSVVQTEASLEVKVMPNPFQTQLNLGFSLERASDVQIRLFNALGQEVYRQDAQLEAGTHNLDLQAPAQLPTGLYFLQLETAQGSHIQQLIKR